MAEGSSSTNPVTPQAGPLPMKRGEIGFREDLHGAAEEGRAPTPINLPARHPADRDNDSTHSSSHTPPGTPSHFNDSSTTNPSTPTTSDTSSATDSMAKPRFFKFLKRKNVMALAGLRCTTLVAFLIQLAALGGTIATWVLVARRFLGSKDTPASQMAGISSSIFVHVVFAVTTLGQLIFLERRLFLLRAQRYSFKHPGETLPTSRYLRIGQDPAVSWAPWNRPPLPTYAAALAQSGVGTGDVEDHIIAQPPPPAYGNTRGSTLLLQGFLSDALRAERPASVHSVSSQHSRHHRDSQDRSSSQTPQSRPVSYRSVDSTWEVIQDADRALRLEETLSQLERPATALTRSTSRRH